MLFALLSAQGRAGSCNGAERCTKQESALSLTSTLLPFTLPPKRGCPQPFYAAFYAFYVAFYEYSFIPKTKLRGP